MTRCRGAIGPTRKSRRRHPTGSRDRPTAIPARDFTGAAAFWRGTVPAVIIIIHEITGLNPLVVRFADRVADAGMTVYLPSLFGQPGRPVSGAVTSMRGGALGSSNQSWRRCRFTLARIYCRSGKAKARGARSREPLALSSPSGLDPPWAKSRSSIVWSTGIEVPLAI